MSESEILTSGALPAVTADVTELVTNPTVIEDDVAPSSTISSGEATERIGTGADDPVQRRVSAEVAVTGHSAVNRRRKPRRKHRKAAKRKWKPYDKLSWKERRELEERESQRANRVREVRFAHGQAVAPYNTTQFLMADHNVQTPDYVPKSPSKHGNRTNSGDSSDNYSSTEDEDFMQKEFSEVYDNIHVERLNAMTKDELVQEYMELEDHVEDMQAQLRVSRTADNGTTSDLPTTEVLDEELLEKVRIFENEIRKLIEENKKLRLDNEKMQRMVNQGL